MQIEYVKELPSLEDYNMLRDAVGWGHSDDASTKNGINGSCYSILAKNEGKTIGMGRVFGDGGTFFIVADIIVLPEFQQKGVGKTIVRMIVEWLKDNCPKNGRVWLFAAKGRESFYEQFGFFSRPTEDFGAGMQLDI